MNELNSSENISFFKNMQKVVEENVAITPAQFDEVEVEIHCRNEVLDSYIESLFFNLQTAIAMKGGKFDLSVEEFESYIFTLIKSRVDYVNRNRGRNKPTVFPTERIVVPSYLSCVLSNIGRARHTDYGIELLPKMVVGEDIKFLEKKEMVKISNQLKMLKGIGFEYAEGYTRSTDGSFEFMTMTMMDGYVRSISKDSHPVYALLSSTLNVRGIETVLSPRISYGSIKHLVNLVQGLTALKV
jgi:hypothetical protein